MRLRSLAEVCAAGEQVWFQPALDRLRALASAPDPRLREFLSAEAAVYITRAPGRLDVMGGIADYSGATVLELPLESATWALLQRQATPRCELATLREGCWHFFSIELSTLLRGELSTPEALGSWLREHETGDWAAYVVGVVQLCLQRMGCDAAGGFRLLLDSTLPEGKGVASSAALEVASMTAVLAGCGRELPPLELAASCQWVENHVVGAPCGIMDQITSACGRRNRLLRLRCQPASIEGYLEVPPGYRFYGIDSGIRHAVSGADYGTVRTAAFMGYRMIVEAVDLGGYLCNLLPGVFAARFERSLPEEISGAEFLARYAGIPDTATQVELERSYPVRQATAHPIYEQERGERFAPLLAELPERPEAADELGRLMYASHRSYGACGLGSEGTDRLVALVALAEPAAGLFGAKITGGGSGGTVAVFGTVESEARVRDIAARYARETGRRSEVFSESGPGAAETGVLVIEPGSP
ncbi:MAG TPA: hypothetical protein VGP61_12130 [Gemmatimonadales bacterium]|nr:hypothetical protein [Gemmatimonadales bacterium]